MLAIKYNFFDDLLIGNFMKTILVNLTSLYEYPSQFNYCVTKYGNNGKVYSKKEVYFYLRKYQKRSGMDFIFQSFQDRSKDFLLRFLGADNNLYKSLKNILNKL